MPSAAQERFDERMAKISRFAHASTTGLTLEITVGVELYSTKRVNADEQPIGGVVLETHAGASGFDADTGESVERPAWYTVWDRYAMPGKHIRRIEEDEIDRTTLRVATNLGLIVRDLASELAVYKKARGTRKRGANMLSGYELDLCRYVGALAKVIGGNMLAPVAVERPTVRKDGDEPDESDIF